MQTAKYISPSKQTFTFQWERVYTSFSHKSTNYEFIGIDGGYVQDKGVGVQQYPMTLYIAGKNYLEVAEGLEKALKEKGTGTLYHPVYGTKTVIPSKIFRKDNLVNKVGQTVFEIQFLETLTSDFPNLQSANFEELNNTVKEINLLNLNTFVSKFNVSTSNNQRLSIARLKGVITHINDMYSVLFHSVSNVQAEFDSISSNLTEGLSSIIDNPSILGTELQKLINLPSKLTGYIGLPLKTYNTLFNNLYGNTQPTSEDAYNSKINVKNQITESTFIATSIITAQLNTLLPDDNNTLPFQSQTEAYNALITVNQQIRDNFDSLDAYETGIKRKIIPNLQEGTNLELVDGILTLNSQISGALIPLIYGLKREFCITVNHPMPMLKVIYEAYGELSDETVNLFVKTNNIDGSEFFELPIGREVVFFQ